MSKRKNSINNRRLGIDVERKKGKIILPDSKAVEAQRKFGHISGSADSYLPFPHEVIIEGKAETVYPAKMMPTKRIRRKRTRKKQAKKELI